MKTILEVKATIDGEENTGLISDGYHTFDELYEHRITLFIALCKQIYKPGNINTCPYHVWRSELHADGSKFDGWFIMGIGTENGKQITYHLPIIRWAETDFANTLPNAPEFDGHTPKDVLERIKNL